MTGMTTVNILTCVNLISQNIDTYNFNVLIIGESLMNIKNNKRMKPKWIQMI